MVMSEFARNIYRFIGEYRAILRKTLSQSERMCVLDELRLKARPQTTSDVAFYQIAQSILSKGLRLGDDGGASYYHYSGIDHFYQCLQDFLDDYAIESDRVVHTCQLSSKYFLLGVQLLSQRPEQALDDNTLQQLLRCNAVLARFAGEEPLTRYVGLLSQRQSEQPELFDSLMQNMQQQMQQYGRNESLATDAELLV